MAVIGPELERFGIAFDRLWDISWNRNICALQLERDFFVVEGQSVAGWKTRASAGDDADVVFLAKGLRQLPVNRTELAVPVPFIRSKIVVALLPGAAAFVPLKGVVCSSLY